MATDGDVASAMADTLAEPGPAPLRARIDPDEDCLPMFRPGGAARDVIGAEGAIAAAS